MKTLLKALLLVSLLAGCGQPPAFVNKQPGSDATPTPLDPHGGKIDDQGNPVDTNPNDPFDPTKQLYQVGQNFIAGSPVGNSVQAGLNDPFIESEITMIRPLIQRSLNFTQVNRNTITDHHNQGHSGSQTTDTLYQDISEDILDIMVVIDNSGSMAEEQNNLSTKLAPLLQEVSGANWRIAVNTTDPVNGCIKSVINKGDANAAAAFATAVTAGINGSGNERGVLQAVSGLQAQCLPQQWIRNNSTIAVLIVSDEDNCSNGTGCSGQPYGSANYLSDYLSSIRILGTTARVYGIVWHPSQTQQQCPTGAYKANQYASLISGSNGTWGSICAADYTQTLAAMSHDIAQNLNTQFAMSHIPIINTVKVYVNGVLQVGNYTINQNIVQFNSPPAEGARIDIDYQYGSAPMLTAFELSKTPAVDTLKVYVNGSLKSPTTYSYQSAGNKVVFSTAPPANALVTLQYRENTPALLTSFGLSGAVVVNTIQVLVNGAVQGSGYSFDSGTNSIVFNNAPSDNANIVVNYKEKGAPKLSYAYAVDPEQVANLQVTEKISGNAVPFSYSSGNIVFPAGAWEEGKIVVVSYPNSGFANLEVTLPHTPVANTVSAQAGGSVCSAPQLVVTGKKVKLSGCNFPVSATVVTISYLYLPAGSTTFVFTPAIPVPLSQVAWKVSVNGTPRFDYIRTNKTFTFNNPISSGSAVKIEANYYN